MENLMLEELKTKLVMSALQTNNNADREDVNRNHVSYGSVTAYANVLWNFGVKVSVAVYEENRFLKIPKLTIADKIINFEK